MTIEGIANYLSDTFGDNLVPDDEHLVMVGDFNRRHSWWEERKTHLTSSETLIRPLLDLLYRFDLRMALPANIPTLQTLSTGN